MDLPPGSDIAALVATDIDIVEKHNTDLLEGLREIVCPNTTEDEE